jgi:hypothetical protein
VSIPYNNLLTLNISNNSLTNFSNYTFNSLGVLDLTNNSLISFSVNTLPVIQEIYLANNQLGTFSNVNSTLKVFDISNNNLTMVDSTILLNATTIKIGNNLKLQQFTNNKWPLITNLDFSLSNMMQFSGNDLSAVTSLTMHGNLATFDNNILINLQYLDLSKNMLKTIDLSTYQKLTDLIL